MDKPAKSRRDRSENTTAHVPQLYNLGGVDDATANEIADMFGVRRPTPKDSLIKH